MGHSWGIKGLVPCILEVSLVLNCIVLGPAVKNNIEEPINNHGSSGLRSNHRLFIATVLFRMVRNCRTTLVLQFWTIRNSTVAINN